MNNIQISKNFKLREFACKGGTQQVKIHKDLVDKLQKLRDRVGRPIIINSGYRTPEHNRRVAGSTSSQHVEGRAADIRVTGMSVATLVKHAEAIGFTGIGTYNTFVHVDVRTGARARWNG